MSAEKLRRSLLLPGLLSWVLSYLHAHPLPNHFQTSCDLVKVTEMKLEQFPSQLVLPSEQSAFSAKTFRCSLTENKASPKKTLVIVSQTICWTDTWTLHMLPLHHAIPANSSCTLEDLFPDIVATSSFANNR